jgi:hypothetical protein
MSLKTSYLSIKPDNTWTFHVPSKHLQTSSKKSILLRVGAQEVAQRIVLSEHAPSTASFTTKIKLITKNGSLHAGPFLGILTVKRGSDFKGNKNNFIDIMRTAKEHGAFVFVFTVEDIDWNNRTTSAFVYHETKAEWIRLTGIPLPNVVYNRIPYREDEQKGYVQSALKQLQSIPGLQLYNTHFFNKWNLYQVLADNTHVAHYVPDTVLLNDQRELEQLAKKHPLLYLKPIAGKAGIGIMNIACKKGAYTLRVPQKEKLIIHTFPTMRSLWNNLKSKLNGDYVVQQGITLLKHEERPFDIRVLVQRDGNGDWQLSGVGIRVAGKNSITTHVPRGGSIAFPEQVLLPYFGREQYEERMKQLRKTVIDIASALDENYSSLGEMSMDIGLSPEGKFWFFEANAKPMKFDEPTIRQTSLKRIIHYAQYLSGFTPKGEMQRANQTDLA